MVLSSFSFFKPSEAEAAKSFSDVSDSYWASEEIEYIASRGIVTGKENGTFAPGESVSRAQMSKMIAQALGKSSSYSTSKQSFSDVRTSFWAHSDIEYLSSRGVVTGRENGLFDPNGNVTRAQIAVIIDRGFYGQNSIHNPSIPHTDVPSNFWARDEIGSLVQRGIVAPADRFRPNDSANRAEVAVYLARLLEPKFRPENQTTTPAPTPTQPPAEEVSGSSQYKGVVQAPTPLNVRSSASGSSTSLGTLANGTIIDVYGNSGNWLEVRYNGRKAYVSGSFVHKGGGTEGIVGTAKVNVANTLNVRSQPNSSSTRVGTLANGQSVNIYHFVNSSWALIYFKGQWAYAHRSYLQDSGSVSGLRGQTIVIDAGHGGNDPGAVANGLQEKNINLAVSLEVQKLLRTAGANVVMTRTNDTFLTLAQRVAIGERANASSFISVHANAAASPAANGAETFYNSGSEAAKSRDLAASIQNRLVRETAMNDRSVKQGNFYVIRNTSMPSTLIELGFLTNSSDAAKMKAPGYNQKAGQAVFNGIADYYNGL